MWNLLLTTTRVKMVRLQTDVNLSIFCFISLDNYATFMISHNIHRIIYPKTSCS